MLMKTIPVSCLLAGMFLPVLSFAQPQPPETAPTDHKKTGRTKPEHPFQEAWKSADSNQDGFISMEEFGLLQRLQNLAEEKRNRLFARLDKDEDGKLSRDELARMNKPHGDQPEPPSKKLWELDTDKSGGVSFEEFKVGQFLKKLSPEKQQEVFTRLDTDGDGLVTPKDRPEPNRKRSDGARPGNQPPPEPFNRKLDLDGDGALSFEEFRAGIQVRNLSEDEQEDRFESIDRNGDQKISPQDFPPPPPPPKAE